MPARRKPSSDASPAGTTTALTKQSAAAIRLDDPLKRDFYAEMCRIEKWNTRTLHQKIQSMLTPDLIPPLERSFKF